MRRKQNRTDNILQILRQTQKKPHVKNKHEVAIPLAFGFRNSKGKCMCTHIRIIHFSKTCRKSYYNGIVSYLKHMGRGKILEDSNSGGFSIGRWRTCRAIQSGKQVWQATVWLFQLHSPSRCCYGTRIVSEGFNRTQRVR